MSRRATVSIRVDDGLVLRPASPSVLTELQEAFEEIAPNIGELWGRVSSIGSDITIWAREVRSGAISVARVSRYAR